jgi:hypothetical protein
MLESSCNYAAVRRYLSFSWMAVSYLADRIYEAASSESVIPQHSCRSIIYTNRLNDELSVGNHRQTVWTAI